MAAATNQNEHDMKTPSSSASASPSASASQDRDLDHHDHERHVHFTEEDINRKKGKEHNEHYHSADTHMPEPLHVNFTQEDIQRKEGKNHKDYPKTHAHVAKSRPRPQSQSGYEPHNGSWETSLNGSTKVKVSKEDFFLHLKIGCAMLILFFGGTMIASYKFANNQNAGANANAENGAVATEKKSVYDDILEREQNQLKLMEPPYPLLNEQLIRRTATGSSTADHDHDDDDRAYTLNAECNLFLADSSILGHGRGLGVFTTKSFEEGEVVFPGLGLGSGLEGGLEADAFGTKGIELPLHSHLVLLKQHHIYGNVIQGSSKQQKQGDGGGGGDGSITSKRSIQAGEELFVNFQDLNENYKEIYHKRLHVHDPTLEEYQMADEIIAEAMAAIPTKVVYEGSGDRNVKKYKSGRGRNKQRTKRVVPSVDAASILNLLKSTVARYDQRLAALIPESTAEARSILDDSGEGGGGTANFISNRRSVDWIRANGLCLDGLYPGLSSAISTGTGAGKSAVGTFASRDVSVGDIITTAPLYAMKKSHSVANMHCYDAPVDDISLCPLSFAALMHNGDDEEKVCSNSNENEDCPSTVGPANAKVQWSEFNMSNRRRNDITADEFIQHPLTGMTVDVIATQPISKGEEVIISSNNGNLFHS